MTSRAHAVYHGVVTITKLTGTTPVFALYVRYAFVVARVLFSSTTLCIISNCWRSTPTLAIPLAFFSPTALRGKNSLMGSRCSTNGFCFRPTNTFIRYLHGFFSTRLLAPNLFNGNWLLTAYPQPTIAGLFSASNQHSARRARDVRSTSLQERPTVPFATDNMQLTSGT